MKKDHKGKTLAFFRFCMIVLLTGNPAVKLSLHLPLFIVERIDVSTHGSGREEELSSLPIHAIVSLTILYNATGGSELGIHYFLGNGVSSE